MSEEVGTRRRSGERWWWYVTVAGITAVGLTIRVLTVLGNRGRIPGGDTYSYYWGADLLAKGHGFINPWLYKAAPPKHFIQQSASYPPLFLFILTIVAVVGFKSFFAARIWTCIVAALAIPLAAYAGREISGRRVGLIAAVFVAIYPNIWINDEMVMSEALSPVLALLVALAAYRLWKRPRPLTAAGFGVTVGLAALGRDEMVLLAALVVPLIVFARKLAWRRRFGLLGVAAAAVIVVVGPWVGYNMTRFAKPTFISTGFGVTLASANCATTYDGQLAGYWSMPCALGTPGLNSRLDQSVTSSIAQSHAVHFITGHLGELPRVELEREGRAFGFYAPIQQVYLDNLIETRPVHWAEVGLGSYYFLLALAVPGVISLRRRRIPVYPLIALAVDVVVSVALTFGQTRYRAVFEAALVLAAAVGADALVRGVAARLRRSEPSPAVALDIDLDDAPVLVGRAVG